MRPRIKPRDLLFASPALLAGPLLYFLLPSITHADLPAWLARVHLTGASLLLMVPYFGLVHPFLEQAHWAPLRERTPLAHLFFAGYHALVLSSLLTLPWLLIVLCVLTLASFLWRKAGERFGSIAVPLISHLFADLGIVIIAWLRSQRG